MGSEDGGRADSKAQEEESQPGAAKGVGEGTRGTLGEGQGSALANARSTRTAKAKAAKNGVGLINEPLAQ